ncbi:MAG: hypothetical protein LBB62_05135 [Proteiniphilum sp.]|jgi:hypothetical protein|nr:hypothetical protein [Proteiniphilum sp.]
MENKVEKQVNYYENVKLLFGLGASELNFNFLGTYYDFPRINSVAITDILKKMWEFDYQTDGIKEFFLSISPVIELDKGAELYDDFKNDARNRKGEYTPDDQTALKLHTLLTRIIKQIDSLENGIYTFISEVGTALTFVEDKRAANDMTTAALCCISIYIAFERNKQINRK